MSCRYNMYVEVTGYNYRRMSEIRDAMAKEWNWDDDSWCKNKNTNDLPFMSAFGQSNLDGSEYEFAERLRLAIWQANQAYCRVYVATTCMGDLPYTSYEGDEGEYEEARAEGLLKVPDKRDRKKTKPKKKESKKKTKEVQQ